MDTTRYLVTLTIFIVTTARIEAINIYTHAFLKELIILIPSGKFVTSFFKGINIPPKGKLNIGMFLLLYTQPYLLQTNRFVTVATA